MRYPARTLPLWMATIAFLGIAGCARAPSPVDSDQSPSPSPAANGGGLLGDLPDHPEERLIEVRGYVLAPDANVPNTALGYAVPIFTSREEAQRFCPLFVGRLTFGGQLTGQTKLEVRSYGQMVQIAPFIWPVTSWSPGDIADCNHLVERYNISAARSFYAMAVEQIRKNGGSVSDLITDGPFIATARRVSATVMLFDLSRAPRNDYPRWFEKAVEELSNPAINAQSRYVTPPWRDRMRYYVFGAIPAWQPLLNALIPGFDNAHGKS